LAGSSLLLSGPGLYCRGSSPSLSGSHTATGSSSSSTPITPSKRFQTGIDPKEVSKALRKLKDRIGHSKETREAKYVQAKSDLASRRTLALLLTYALMLYGAPSHRLEEYILALFKVCGLDGRVNYIVSVYIFSSSSPIAASCSKLLWEHTSTPATHTEVHTRRS
jgi:hypothetical protein